MHSFSFGHKSSHIFHYYLLVSQMHAVQCKVWLHNQKGKKINAKNTPKYEILFCGKIGIVTGHDPELGIWMWQLGCFWGERKSFPLSTLLIIASDKSPSLVLCYNLSTLSCCSMNCIEAPSYVRISLTAIVSCHSLAKLEWAAVSFGLVRFSHSQKKHPLSWPGEVWNHPTSP